MTKLRFVAISAISLIVGSLWLTGCGSAGDTTGTEEAGVWPQEKPANAQLQSVPEGGGTAEENQCLGPNYCTSSPGNCCSHWAWGIGAPGCTFACCLPNGWGTAGGEQCCSGRAHYSGSSLVCY
ncbi:MAG TPA: hypothetical protein VER11_19990 [Polyangiaceae bacterium]|nr:hypothetical protein [Polyangiaceae bacterium]